MKQQKKKRKSPKDSNNRAKQWFIKQLKEEMGLGEDTLRTWTTTTKNTADLLVTSADCQKTALLHIQYSKSYPQDYACEISGWHGVASHILKSSKAKFWVFVCAPTRGRVTAEKCHYVIISPEDLQKRLESRGPQGQKVYYIYLKVIDEAVVDARGIETRGKHHAQGKTPREIQDALHDTTSPRNYTRFHNNWEPLKDIFCK